ncbi:MAG: hypothetical protein ACD_75C00020G0003 [uncultured bacterium]|nr:MAG: hypothetical protein ACD_75C00020G0003 [uncultured bacterium]
MHKGEPVQTILLIAAEPGLKGFPELNGTNFRRTAQFGENRLQPRPMGDPGFHLGGCAPQHILRIDRKPHGIAKTDPLLTIQFFCLFIGGKRLAQFFRIDRNPFVLQEGQPRRLLQEKAGLRSRYFGIANHQPGMEIEQGCHTDGGRRLLADADLYADACRLGLPPVRDAAENAGLFVQRDLLQKGKCFFSRPGKGVEQFAGIEQTLHQFALVRRLMDGNQQLKKSLVVVTVFFQGILQRQMARFPRIVQPGGIGSQKGKRGIAVLVFDQMEIDPADQVDFRAELVQILGHRAGKHSDLPGKYPVQPGP